ncbi:MAG TPA: CBS domain-containing protein [Candidatus Nanoarchaeia archaeon]|nr:CBS domain-containing protein [Candidatus Nanoarchaeia archaeon]
MDTGYRVSDLMNQKVVTVSSNSTLRSCAQLMAAKKIGSVIVKDGKKTVGILTEQDLARKVVAQGIDADESVVAQLMARKIVTIMPQDDIYTAMVRMGKYNIKHLPVMKGEDLVGILTIKDIMHANPALLEKMNIGR